MTDLEQALKEIRQLRADLQKAQATIAGMLRTGGFADSKALSIRSTRIEERVERLELDAEMLKDVAAVTVDQMAAHLDRHQAPERDNTPDAIFIRKIRRRMHDWAEKRGLIGKRTDLRDSRNGENRLRPSNA